MEHLLDTSALIVYLCNEKGADKVAKIITNSALPFIALSEIYYIIWHKKGEAEADRIFGIVKSWGLPILLPDEKVILTAGRYKAIYKLGLADSFIAAFAFDKNIPLVTRDEDYIILKNEIKIHFI